MSRSNDNKFDELGFTPVIIIGAGRSGTNVLRDTLCRLTQFETWDCDEINPVWRHFNVNFPHDEFTLEMATPGVKKFIRDKFSAQWKKMGGAPFLVEKTCANSLRVGFVAEIFPEAKFVYLVRHGEDVVASAKKRWQGQLEVPGIPYYWRKIRYTPLSDLPRYALRFIQNRWNLIIDKAGRLSFWGPQFDGLSALPADTDLSELTARQWAACINASDKAFAQMESSRFLTVYYEDLVTQPAIQIREICRFVGLNNDEDAIKSAIAPISSSSVGKGRRIEDANADRTRKIMHDALERHDYLKVDH